MKKIHVMPLLLIIVLTALSNPAFSQVHRAFPVNSKLGYLTAVSFPIFTINGVQYPMSAGGQIRGTDNLIILPSVANYIGIIRYQLDATGNLHRVWILTTDEVKAAENEGQRIPKPPKRFFFF
ncbi:hypothetical protein [Nitrosomonas sp.]|uniref:hypothetical protein n=1 Tax=Nitrosomonas sp. TaxID=42353 RepID=UPI0026057C6F|nr:hypothetical protein [Nitrosomonas sp.]